MRQLLFVFLRWWFLTGRQRLFKEPVFFQIYPYFVISNDVILIRKMVQHEVQSDFFNKKVVAIFVVFDLF